MIAHGIRKSLILLLPLAVITLAGCPFSPGRSHNPVVDPPSEYLPATTVSNVLENLKKSYEKHEFLEYQKLFASNYEYVFSPRDVGNDGIPESWGISDELASADNLFKGEANKEGYRMEAITLTFDKGNPVIDPQFPDWTKVTLAQVYLTVTTRHKDTGDPLDYRVLGDQADLYFLQTEERDPTTSAKLWKIVRWDDKPIVSALASN